VRVVGLCTSFNSAANRVAMHAVRRTLVEEQARQTGLPLICIDLPWPCTNAQYEQIMTGVCRRAVLDQINGLQKFNRRILQKLRPVGLHELGLEAALGAAVQLWRDTRPDVTIEMTISPALGEIGDTAELAEIIRNAIPAPARRRGGHPAKRVFQAIRIEVNAEIDILDPSLRAAMDLLAPGGRLAVLTYHSGEDRVVKAAFV